MRAVGAGVVALEADHHVVVLAGAVGAIRRRQVGCRQQEILQPGTDRPGPGVQLPLLISQRPAADAQLIGPGLVARGAGTSHLLRQEFDLGPQIIPATGQVA